MESWDNKFRRSLRESLVYWFLEATETFFSKKILCACTQHKTNKRRGGLFLLTPGWGGVEDDRRCLPSASLAAPCPAPHSPILPEHHQGSCCPISQIRKLRLLRGKSIPRIPGGSQRQSWDPKPGCCLPCTTHTHVQL